MAMKMNSSPVSHSSFHPIPEIVLQNSKEKTDFEFCNKYICAVVGQL